MGKLQTATLGNPGSLVVQFTQDALSPAAPLCTDTAHLSDTPLCWSTASNHFQACFSDKQYELRTFLHCLSMEHWNGFLIKLFLLKLAGDCQGVERQILKIVSVCTTVHI